MFNCMTYYEHHSNFLFHLSICCHNRYNIMYLDSGHSACCMEILRNVFIKNIKAHTICIFYECFFRFILFVIFLLFPSLSLPFLRLSNILYHSKVFFAILSSSDGTNITYISLSFTHSLLSCSTSSDLAILLTY